MKNFSLAQVIALAAFSALPLVAQQPDSQSPEGLKVANATVSQSGQEKDRNSSAPAVPVPSTANSPEIANSRLRPIRGELVARLDSRNAKTGDSVVIRTTETAATATGIEIPVGSRIVGRITDVQPKASGSNGSRVSISFDEALLKGGEKIPIQSVIQSISGSGNPEKAGSSAIPQSQGVRPDFGSPSAPAGTVVARNGNVAIRTTGIPGVLLAANVDGQPVSNASGALLGSQGDVRLDGGTTMVLAIAMAPATASIRR